MLWLIAQFLAWYPRTLMWKGRWGWLEDAECQLVVPSPDGQEGLGLRTGAQVSVCPVLSTSRVAISVTPFPLGSGLVGVTDGVCLFIYTVPVQTHQLRCRSVGAPAPARHLGRDCPGSSALARLWNTPDNPAVVPGTHEDKKKKQDHFCFSTGRVGDGKTK